jgi:hypothetical protein
MTTTILTPNSRRGLFRLLGVVLVLVSIIAPAFPLGPLASHPWMPLAVLWAAYGWAAEPGSDWRAPLALFGFGVLHDGIAGGPLGLFATLYPLAFLIGKLAAASMRSPNVVSLWAGFIAMAVGVWLAAAAIAPWALGGQAAMAPWGESLLVTSLLFPLVRPLYMDVTTV